MIIAYALHAVAPIIFINHGSIGTAERIKKNLLVCIQQQKKILSLWLHLEIESVVYRQV